ncbi:hypothetical protein HZH66_003062 [Vespula vulgaris]|uniref:Uncharacterized protein n=1 Tax=Vespula vulgaris TaxID=7454 RepID=A0A834NFT4_VESVU|nr:hypothetical protein HZH66_003062 [Vespula vulgaris]
MSIRLYKGVDYKMHFVAKEINHGCVTLACIGSPLSRDRTVEGYRHAINFRMFELHCPLTAGTLICPAHAKLNYDRQQLFVKIITSWLLLHDCAKLEWKHDGS